VLDLIHVGRRPSSSWPGATPQEHRSSVPSWPKAKLIVAWGNAPGTPIIGSVLAEGPIHTWEPMPQVSLAFGQTCSMASISWGVAPGYGDDGLRPTAMLGHFPGALPQATVMMAFGQLPCSIIFLGRCPRLR
jgi:hypothetical protein